MPSEKGQASAGRLGGDGHARLPFFLLMRGIPNWTLTEYRFACMWETDRDMKEKALFILDEKKLDPSANALVVARNFDFQSLAWYIAYL